MDRDLYLRGQVLKLIEPDTTRCRWVNSFLLVPSLGNRDDGVLVPSASTL